MYTVQPPDSGYSGDGPLVHCGKVVLSQTLCLKSGIIIIVSHTNHEIIILLHCTTRESMFTKI